MSNSTNTGNRLIFEVIYSVATMPKEHRSIRMQHYNVF